MEEHAENTGNSRGGLDAIDSPSIIQDRRADCSVSISLPQDMRLSDLVSIDRHIKNLSNEQIPQPDDDSHTSEANRYVNAAFPLSKRQKKTEGKADYTTSRLSPIINLFHVRGTILSYLPKPLLFITAWTSICVSVLLVDKIAFIRDIIPRDDRFLTMTVLSIVVSLLLGYKNNICYDRYWEARRIWAHLECLSIDLTIIVWYLISSHTQRQQQEKIGAVNLVIAFVSSTRHYMRNELGIFYDDLCPYISHLKPSFGDREPSTKRLSLEISYHLHLYIEKAFNEGQLPETLLSHTCKAISGMNQCFTSFERIRLTPIPLAYSIHIRQGLYLYVLSLPFQMYSTCGWMTIPIIILVSFILLGVDFIGYDIQDPFGYSSNDLHLDEYFKKIETEILAIMETDACHHPDTWVKPYTRPPESPFSSKVANTPP